LKDAVAGLKVEDICCKIGICNATYYKWKPKYGGMEASDIKRIKELEEENAELKKLFGGVSLENQAIKKGFPKNGW